MDNERGTNKKYFRSQDEVEGDYIMPNLGLGIQPGTEVRMGAILEVLRRLPEKDYRRLEELDGNNEFQWFIPNACWLGEAYPFPANIYGETQGNMEFAPYAKAIYLSPIIENGVGFDIAVAVVAHELAHIILSHKVRPDPETYDKQEKEAWEKVIEWGFKEEERKHREYSADPADKRVSDIIRRFLRELPATSDSRIGRIVGCEAGQVSRIRRDMLSSGELHRHEVDEDKVGDV